MQVNKQVVLVLGSGGARGYTHISVIEELEAYSYEITCIAGYSMGSVINGIYATGKLREYREQVGSLDYLDMLRLLGVSSRLGAIRGEWVFSKIHEILGGVNIENLPIPYTAIATDLTNQQEIWFQEGRLHQTVRVSAAIPNPFTPVMQDNRMLVDDGLLDPLPIIPVVSAHNGLIIAASLNATSQKQYHLSVIERSAAPKGRLDGMIESLSHELPFFHRHGDDNTPPELSTGTLLCPVPTGSKEPAGPQLRQPATAPQDRDSPRSTSSTTVMKNSDPASLLELVNQSFEVMQTPLAQYKITGYLPDVLINVPERVCRFFEFYKAPELITFDRQIASDTLNHYEEDNA